MLRTVVATLLNASRIAGGHTPIGLQSACSRCGRLLGGLYELFEEALDIAVDDRTAAAANGSAAGTLSALTGAGVPEFGYISDLRLASSGGGPRSGTPS
jgi:hypothetical protein